MEMLSFIYVQRGNNLYGIPDLYGKAANPLSTTNCRLVTVVPFEEVTKHGSIEQVIEYMIDYDGVYSSDFLDTVVVQYRNTRDEAGEAKRTQSRCHFAEMDVPVTYSQVPHNEEYIFGPFAIVNDKYKRVCRIFPDTHGAFVSSVSLNSAGSESDLGFQELAAPMLQNSMGVAIPSRLYYPASEDLPLNGLHIAVKDNIDLAGAVTGAGSKAYARLYGLQARTASCIQELVRLGAVIIGKTKTAQFADGDTTTSDWVEFSCPWNPRDDGYLIPSCSSTGSACAVASYDWVDASIGTDSECNRI